MTPPKNTHIINLGDTSEFCSLFCDNNFVCLRVIAWLLLFCMLQVPKKKLVPNKCDRCRGRDTIAQIVVTLSRRVEYGSLWCEMVRLINGWDFSMLFWMFLSMFRKEFLL